MFQHASQSSRRCPWTLTPKRTRLSGSMLIWCVLTSELNLDTESQNGQFKSWGVKHRESQTPWKSNTVNVPWKSKCFSLTMRSRPFRYARCSPTARRSVVWVFGSQIAGHKLVRGYQNFGLFGSLNKKNNFIVSQLGPCQPSPCFPEGAAAAWCCSCGRFCPASSAWEVLGSRPKLRMDIWWHMYFLCFA